MKTGMVLDGEILYAKDLYDKKKFVGFERKLDDISNLIKESKDECGVDLKRTKDALDNIRDTHKTIMRLTMEEPERVERHKSHLEGLLGMMPNWMFKDLNDCNKA